MTPNPCDPRARIRCPRALASALLCAALAAAAQTHGDGQGLTPAPTARSAAFQGALALIAGYGPEIPGAARDAWSGKPAFYLRWGRLSLSSGGVAPRRDEEAVRGIGLDLVDRPRQRISLGLRYDSGRREDASDRLRGLGDVPGTVRLRVAGAWELDRGWRVHASWTLDALGRGGGNLGDLRLQHDRALTPDTTLWASAALTLAGDRYLQTYWGVNEAQAQRSGYAPYTPRMGLRDVTLGVGLRTEWHRHWAVQGGVSLTRLLGPAADSPIVQRSTALGGNVGLVWRF